MPTLTKEFLCLLQDDYTKYDIFIETGTYNGSTIFSMESLFTKLYTIEISEKYYKNTKGKYNGNKINFLLGDSSTVLQYVLPTITEKCIIFLDGHWSGDDTGQGEKDCPLIEEVTLINKLCKTEAIIIIDDCRLFEKGPKNGYNEDWSDINTPKLVSILQNRISKTYHLDTEYDKDDRLIIHIHAKEDEDARKIAIEKAMAKVKADEEAKVKADEEAKVKADDEARKIAIVKSIAEAKVKADEEAKVKADDEARKIAIVKSIAEAKVKADEDSLNNAIAEAIAKVKADEKAEVEAKVKADEEAKVKADEEAKAKADEDVKAKADEEAKVKADEEAKAKADENALNNAIAETKIKANEDALNIAIAEAMAKIKADEDARKIAIAKSMADEEAVKVKKDELAKDEALKTVIAEAFIKAVSDSKAKEKAEDERIAILVAVAVEKALSEAKTVGKKKQGKHCIIS